MACLAVTPVADMQETLRITEIFYSLQGETRTAGLPTVFVRLTGCPLRCQYCDTAYAFHGGNWWSISDILAEVASHRVGHVCVTGGEPLAQKRCLALLEALCEAGYRVSLETSGAIDISAVDPRVSRVLDIKTPGSGECVRNLWRNLDSLCAHDQIKFVICDRADYDWAVQQVRERALDRICTVWFSPSQGQLAAGQLADWIVADRLPVRFQIQLHKALWGDTPGR
ncbi:MAG: 7-carboxy-7-deazaguanine synthase QueE [Gammaproteobacteria bacterium HGW-Gammaproteobacteria-7]|nr:MAG: 7-carboxy-7-deazaguanine synthase QueE [Gammaproteobacteria bacterium HGW-Gammaproteobacteria-7]